MAGCVVTLMLLTVYANAQTSGLHLLGSGQLQPPPPPRQANVPAQAQPRIVPQSRLGSFVLRKVIVRGATLASPAAIAEAYAPAIGRRVNGADIARIGQRIGLAESRAGAVLYTVSVPPQKITNGVLRLDVIEGSVTHVEIEGAKDPHRLQLIHAYARHILHSRPLRRGVLERNILLMGQIAGAKIGSKFLTDPEHPGSATLLLALRQSRLFGGFDINNQGTPLLDNTQAVFNAGVNDLFREGERTQLVLSVPLDVRRYQYYGINDIEPIGGDGLTVSLTAGELVSHPGAHDVVSGTADLAGMELQYPLILRVHRVLTLGAGFDFLDSSDAFLGFTTSDERTRDISFSLFYSDDEYLNGINRLSASVTQGLDILGARRASIAYGAPAFTKADLRVDRYQVLPKKFVLHLSVSVQVAADRLPPSQEFQYGGPEYGLAFYTAELSGDEGVAALADFSHVLPSAILPKALDGSAAFVSADYGRIWNRQPIYVPPTDRGASFAAGLRLKFRKKFQLELAAATPLLTPRTAPHNQRWRFVVQTSGRF